MSGIPMARWWGEMESGALTAIIALLSVIAGGVLTFAREVVKAEREDKA